MDFSPLHGYDHAYNDYMAKKVYGIEWNKPRELPEWAKEIFSDNMLAVGNIRDGEELDQFMAITKDLVDHYDDFESDLWGGKIKREKQYREMYKKWIR